jgi:hypothetical protein
MKPWFRLHNRKIKRPNQLLAAKLIDRVDGGYRPHDWGPVAIQIPFVIRTRPPVSTT